MFSVESERTEAFKKDPVGRGSETDKGEKKSETKRINILSITIITIY